MGERRPPVDFNDVRKVISVSPIWPIFAIILVVIVTLSTVRVGRIEGTEVGVLLNKMNGSATVINQSGVKIYNGITSELFVLDKTLQTLEMTATEGRGDRAGKDNLKIKTVDGSDVYVDLKVQYKINPEMAAEILASSGPGNSFKHKWARSYVRSIVRNDLGELQTEDFYDSALRKEKVAEALRESREKLAPFGIHIDSIVIPTRPQFYKEYEQMIKRKKLADQAVLEERSKALAAQQRQETMVVTETNKKNVAIAEFDGMMKQKIIQINADGERAKKTADAYFEKVTVGATATLYESTKSADAILAEKEAEAEGIKKLKQALEGPGGRNMVKMEYAKKLTGITITGQPFTHEARAARFEHIDASVKARAKGRK